MTRDHLDGLVRTWRDHFDWRAVQDRLNAWPTTTTTIDGQPVHAIHARSPRPDATPLLLLHGWPSTVADFLTVLGPLIGRFHVVAARVRVLGPTLETGCGLDRHADTLLELMGRCGYERSSSRAGTGAGSSRRTWPAGPRTASRWSKIWGIPRHSSRSWSTERVRDV